MGLLNKVWPVKPTRTSTSAPAVNERVQRQKQASPEFARFCDSKQPMVNYQLRSDAAIPAKYVPMLVPAVLERMWQEEQHALEDTADRESRLGARIPAPT